MQILIFQILNVRVKAFKHQGSSSLLLEQSIKMFQINS